MKGQVAEPLNGVGHCRPVLLAQHAAYVDWSMPKAKLVMRKSTLHSTQSSQWASSFRQEL